MLGIDGPQIIFGHSQDILGSYSTANGTLSSSSSVDGFPASWTQLVADVGDRPVLITDLVIEIDSNTSNMRVEVEFGIGAASSESRVFAVVFPVDGSERHYVTFHNINRRIPASSRVSARIRDSGNSSEDYFVSFNYIKL